MAVSPEDEFKNTFFFFQFAKEALRIRSLKKKKVKMRCKLKSG